LHQQLLQPVSAAANVALLAALQHLALSLAPQLASAQHHLHRKTNLHSSSNT
jgi:hypothetical protein